MPTPHSGITTMTTSAISLNTNKVHISTSCPLFATYSLQGWAAGLLHVLLNLLPTRPTKLNCRSFPMISIVTLCLLYYQRSCFAILYRTSTDKQDTMTFPLFYSTTWLMYFPNVADSFITHVLTNLLGLCLSLLNAFPPYANESFHMYFSPNC